MTGNAIQRVWQALPSRRFVIGPPAATMCCFMFQLSP
jgi:hypothetical protein